MHVLSFTLSPEAVFRVHDVVLCLARFSETIFVEARSDKLILSALNSSKSAHASFTFDRTLFFEKYYLDPFQTKSQQARNDAEASFTCQLYNKALLSVFKGQLRDLRDKDSAIERCECHVQEGLEESECRLIIQMVCRHGVKKTYKLTYEPAEVTHALFNRSQAKNVWRIAAMMLRSLIEYFSAGTEQLDISTEGGRTTFTSYTEKVVNGKEILKQPLQTSVTIDNLDFEKFEVEEELHIGITVKDFKAIATHADSLKTSVTAYYSFPNRPMQLSYNEIGIICDFTLMTIGEYRGGSVTPAPMPTRKGSVATLQRPPAPKQQEASRKEDSQATAMPPPNQPASRSFPNGPLPSQGTQRPSPPPPKPSLDPDSLFLPQYDDEDRQWGEQSYNDEEETVGWSASAVNIRSFASARELKKSSSRLEPYQSRPEDVPDRLPPTQRLSQVENLFGE